MFTNVPISALITQQSHQQAGMMPSRHRGRLGLLTWEYNLERIPDLTRLARAWTQHILALCFPCPLYSAGPLRVKGWL